MKRFKTRKKAGGPNRSEALECIPIKNDKVEESRQDNGELLLIYPIIIRPWLAGLFRRSGGNNERTIDKKLQLDTLGTEVWDLMDGHTSVHRIIKQFASTHRLPLREAEISVTRFLRDLGKRGLIGLR
jgi:hypothetical protein